MVVSRVVKVRSSADKGLVLCASCNIRYGRWGSVGRIECVMLDPGQ